MFIFDTYNIVLNICHDLSKSYSFVYYTFFLNSHLKIKLFFAIDQIMRSPFETVKYGIIKKCFYEDITFYQFQWYAWHQNQWAFMSYNITN